jgi:hypothetical protein
MDNVQEYNICNKIHRTMKDKYNEGHAQTMRTHYTPIEYNAKTYQLQLISK